MFPGFPDVSRLTNQGQRSQQQQYALVCLSCLMRQGLTEAVLVGHSMGGKAAAMTALLHPHVVKGLIVMDIAPVSYSM